MISQKAFDKAISLLEKTYDREIHREVAAIWYNFLSHHLTDKELAIATQTIICNSPYFPTPAQLVNAVKEPLEVRAEREWQIVYQVASRYCHGRLGNGASVDERGQKMLEELSDRGRTSLDAVGGVFRIGETPDNQIGYVEGSFKRVYVKCNECPVKPLPPTFKAFTAKSVGYLPEGGQNVEFSQFKQSEKVSKEVPSPEEIQKHINSLFS